MMNKVILVCSAVFFCLCLLLGGCGGPSYKGDQRYPLQGAATFDGQPIDLGSISLVPAGKEGSEGRASGGVITDGKYSIPEESGPTAGKYRVEVHWLKLTGKRLLDKDTGEMYDQRLEALPAKYHSQSELTVDVPTPGNSHDLTLKSS
jgi:hypothetical protein